MHNIPYVIFDSKSLPFTYVMGGTTFNVPSYKKLIVKKLELDTTNTSNHCNSEEKGWLTRQDVIESLLQRVQSKLITCTRIVHIEHTSSKGFYLHSSSSSSSKQRQSHQQHHQSCEIHGPYKYIIGADGVLSQVRSKALHSTYLIGDARWAQDRYYDLGYQRIKEGANIALLDGLELGQLLVYDNMMKRGSTTTKGKDDGQERQESMTHEMNVAALKFCAWDISRRRTKRRRFIFFIILVVIIMIYTIYIRSEIG